MTVTETLSYKAHAKLILRPGAAWNDVFYARIEGGPIFLTIQFNQERRMAAAPMDAEATVKQFKEFLLSYNKLSEMCFNDCANDFTTRKVLDSEEKCSVNCMEKYLKMTQRISLRFQEYQVQQSENSSPMPGLVQR